MTKKKNKDLRETRANARALHKMEVNPPETYYPTAKEVFLAGFTNDLYDEVTVYVSIPGLPELEEIRNPKVNFGQKKAYYNDAYDDDLHLKANPKIWIVNYDFR